MTHKSIIAALAEALPELEGAKKNAANGAFKGTKYANLTAVMEAIEPIRTHGLWYRQVSHHCENGACIETIYIHDSGEELSAGKLFVKADKATAQGNGSAVTYARRYSLQTAFGLDAEDDDGNAASTPPKPPAISEEQRVELVALFDATGFKQAVLLKKASENTGVQVDDLRDLPASEFSEIKAFLEGKKEKVPENA